MNNRIINATVILIAMAFAGWFGFKSYLNAHKAGSEAEKSESVENDFNNLNGSYLSEKTDPPTSELLFETYGTTATEGKFKNIEISANFNGGTQSSINVTIDVSSIYTAESMRDDHLKGEDFFNVEKFSTITFKSSDVIATEDGFLAKGDITFLGSTKSLDIPFSYLGSAKEKENVEIFEGKFDFNPENYGMESDAGDKVTVSFYTELVKQ